MIQASRGMTLQAFRSMPSLADILEQNMVDVITPREAWIEHDTEILELVDPILKVLSKAETLKIATLESL